MQTRYAFSRLSVGTRVDEVRTIPEFSFVFLSFKKNVNFGSSKKCVLFILQNKNLNGHLG